jgi:hypothetical protein
VTAALTTNVAAVLVATAPQARVGTRRAGRDAFDVGGGAVGVVIGDRHDGPLVLVEAEGRHELTDLVGRFLQRNAAAREQGAHPVGQTRGAIVVGLPFDERAAVVGSKQAAWSPST